MVDKICKKKKLVNIFKTKKINQQQASGLEIAVDVVMEKLHLFLGDHFNTSATCAVTTRCC